MKIKSYDHFEILQVIKIFIENLYTCKDSELFYVNIAEVIKISHIPKLDKNTAESLECIVSEKDILSALKNMKNTTHMGVMDSRLSFSSSTGMTLRVTWYQQFNVFLSRKASYSQRLGKISC